MFKVIFKMSHRLFVTRIVDRARVMKRWYAESVSSNISIAELFTRFRNGDLDGTNLGNKYIGCQVFTF